ncbi:MAG: tyrosine recombinase [Bacteroidetes bacterium]|nr:tyrosine recombinase [Bacteroidota bacterium]
MMEKIVRNYLEYLEAERNYSANTILSYETDLLNLLKFLRDNGIKSFGEVHKESLRAYIGFLLDHDFNQSSVARKIASMRSFFRYLKGKRIIDSNPAAVLITPKTKRKLPAFLDEKSINNLLSEMEKKGCSSILDRAILELFYSTGIRLSELIDLKQKDFRPEEKIIKVKGKGRKERFVPVGGKAISVINEYIASRRGLPAAGNKIKGENYLFVTDKGRKLYPQAVGRLVRKYIGAISEIEKKSPHVLRHTFATHMLNHGADIRAVKELLGHESLSTTQIYTHISSARMKKIYEESHPKA